MAARSSLLVRGATSLTDRQIQKIADEPKGVRAHAGQLAKLRVRFELAKGNLAAAIKELGSAPQSNHTSRGKLSSRSPTLPLIPKWSRLPIGHRLQE